MRIPWKWSVPVACAALVACSAAPPVNYIRGFNDPKNTLFTVSDPIRVGDVTLPPGNYVIQVVDRGTDLNMLQVANDKLTTVYATFQARQMFFPVREIPMEGTLTFVDRPGEPKVLSFWDVPNHTYGYEIRGVPWTPPGVATLIVKGFPLQTASR